VLTNTSWLKLQAKLTSTDPCVLTIVDLKNAADSAGMVTYKFDVVMLTPADASKGNGSLLYIVNNRTNSSAFEALNDGSGNDLFSNVAPVIPTSGVDVVNWRWRRQRLLDEAGHDRCLLWMAR